MCRRVQMHETELDRCVAQLLAKLTKGCCCIGLVRFDAAAGRAPPRVAAIPEADEQDPVGLVEEQDPHGLPARHPAPTKPTPSMTTTLGATGFTYDERGQLTEACFGQCPGEDPVPVLSCLACVGSPLARPAASVTPHADDDWCATPTTASATV